MRMYARLYETTSWKDLQSDLEEIGFGQLWLGEKRSPALRREVMFDNHRFCPIMTLITRLNLVSSLLFLSRGTQNKILVSLHHNALSALWYLVCNNPCIDDVFHLSLITNSQVCLDRLPQAVPEGANPSKLHKESEDTTNAWSQRARSFGRNAAASSLPIRRCMIGEAAKLRKLIYVR